MWANNMERYITFLLMCFFLFAKADEDSGDCRYQQVIDVMQGRKLTLISDVDPLARCYFVSTTNDGDQCCFDKDKSDEDCETSDKYKHQNSMNCPKYELTCDSSKTFTCNLTITSVSEAVAGQYKSYDANHEPIQECVVTVSGGDAAGTIWIILVIIVLAALSAFASGAFFWYRKRYMAVTGIEEGHQMNRKASIGT